MNKPKLKKSDNTLLMAGGAVVAVAALAFFMLRPTAVAAAPEVETTTGSGNYLNPYANMFDFLKPTEGFGVHNWFVRPGGAVADLLHPFGTPAPTNPLAPKSGGHYDLGFQPYVPGATTPEPSPWTPAGNSAPTTPSGGGSFGVGSHYR